MSQNTGTNDVAPVEGDFADVEARLAIVGVQDQRESRELLERLVDMLLTGAGGLDEFDTDGLVVSRQVDLLTAIWPSAMCGYFRTDASRCIFTSSSPLTALPCGLGKCSSGCHRTVCRHR